MRFSVVWNDREKSRGVMQTFLDALPRYPPRLVERNTNEEPLAPRIASTRARRARNTSHHSTRRSRPREEILEEREEHVLASPAC